MRSLRTQQLSLSFWKMARNVLRFLSESISAVGVLHGFATNGICRVLRKKGWMSFVLLLRMKKEAFSSIIWSLRRKWMPVSKQPTYKFLLSMPELIIIGWLSINIHCCSRISNWLRWARRKRKRWSCWRSVSVTWTIQKVKYRIKRYRLSARNMISIRLPIRMARFRGYLFLWYVLRKLMNALYRIGTKICWPRWVWRCVLISTWWRELLLPIIIVRRIRKFRMKWRRNSWQCMTILPIREWRTVVVGEIFIITGIVSVVCIWLIFWWRMCCVRLVNCRKPNVPCVGMPSLMKYIRSRKVTVLIWIHSIHRLPAV